MPEHLSARDWLDTLTDDQLQVLLEVRSDLPFGAPLRDLDDLAARLEHPMSVSGMLVHLPRPAIEMLEAVTALGASATLDRLIGLLDTGGRETQAHKHVVMHWLDILESVGLAWESADCYTVNRGVHRVVVNPLLMGPPAQVLVADLTVEVLKSLYAGLGVSPPARKADLLAGIGDLYADQARIRKTVGSAPQQVVDALAAHAAQVAADSMAGQESREEEDGYWRPSLQQHHQQQATMRQWARSHGLALSDGYTYNYSYSPVRFPAEVLLALVPPSYRAPFHPVAPALPTAEVSEVQTEHDSAAAVTGAVAAMTAVLESTLRRPLKQVKSGGVGARELKRLVKDVGVEEAEVRLALELGGWCHFFARGEELSAGGRFGQWRRSTPAERAADLLLAWWPLRLPPTLSRDEDGKARPALTDEDRRGHSLAPQVATLLAPLDGAVPSLEAVVERIHWAQPLDHPSGEELRCTWDEAERLGVIRGGRLTRLGRALLTGERTPVVHVLRELLPQEGADVLFGSDLTVVVPGSPTASVVDLLDALAVRESHGVGATWRVTEHSVRDALDRGYTAEALLGELRDIAGKALPQPLEYLLRDIDRRHGQVGVRPAASIIVSEDEGLLAELAATKVLRHLGLAPVAPTVLAGTADVPTTLAALRKAGYLPVEQGTDGTRIVAVRARGPIGENRPSSERGLISENEGGLISENESGATADAEEADAMGVGDGTDDLVTRLEALANDEGVDSLTDEEFDTLLVREFGGAIPGAAAPAHAQEDPAQLIGRLRSGEGPPRDDTDPELLAQVTMMAPRLRPDEQRHLARAASQGGQVVIRYRNDAGNETQRLVSELQLVGTYLTGQCHLRREERFFRLDRITMVAPAL